jgi:nucleoside-diphosphate-sugar epimerase/predicted dehydrogenase
MLKVAIVGAGEIAGYHLQVLKEIKTINVCAICDVDLAKANALGSSRGIISAYNSPAEMLAKERPHVVHVLTPPEFHASISIEAMECGSHVLVEKPMALSSEDASKMVSAAETTGKHLAICEMFLFDPVVIKARNMLAQDSIGQLVHVESYWFTDISGNSNAYSLKGSGSGWAHQLPGGVFANFLDHPVYLQRELLGKIETIGTTCKKVGLNPFVPYDELRVNLLGNDKTGYIVASLNGKPRINLLRLYGTEGVITADMSNLTVTTLKSSRLPSFISKGLGNLTQSYELARDTVATTTAILRKKVKARQGLRNFLNAFYARLNNQAVDFDDPSIFNCVKAAETIRILENIWQSMSSQSDKAVKSAPKSYIDHSCRYEAKDDSNQRPRKVLVTGAGGFLGNHLARELLKKGDVVRLITRKIDKEFEQNKGVEVLYGDIRNPEVIQKVVDGVDIIYHCAAITTNKGPWQNFLDTNITATRHLLDAAVKFGIRRFVFVSSVTVYGFTKMKGNKPIRENDAHGNGLPFYSYYAKSKIEGEKLVWEYYRSKKLPVVILRPGVIFGFKGKNTFKSEKIIFGAKHKVLPYVYVKDVVAALILAGTSDAAVGNAYNVVGDEQPTQAEFKHKINRTIGVDKTGLFLPRPIMYIPALLFELYSKRKKADASPPFNLFFYKSLVRDLRYDNHKIKEELGWVPSYSIEDGIRETFQSINAHVSDLN